MSQQGFQETLITAQVDGPTLTAAAAATCLPAQAKKTLPANFFDTIGKQIRIRASGRVSSVITTPGTVRFDVRLGGTVVFDGLAVLLDTTAAHTNEGWQLEIILTLRACGSAANLMGQGTWTSTNVKGVGTMPLGGLPAILPWASAPAVGSNFDATAAQQLDLFFTQTVATGSLTLHQFTVESLN